MLVRAAQQHLIPDEPKEENKLVLIEKSYVLIIVLKIQKRSVQMGKQVYLIPLSCSVCHSNFPCGVSVEAVGLAYKMLPS